jgi:hypothetical protein
LVLVVLVVSPLFASGVSGQSAAFGPIQASLAQEATRLASASVGRNRPAGRTPWVNETTIQAGNSDDWNAVQRLRRGTRLVIRSAQFQRLRGRISAVDDVTLRVVDHRGNDRVLRRQDVREVRLDDPRFTTAKYAGLGALVGGGVGLAVGHATECGDCELRGLNTFVGGISGAAIGVVAGWKIGSRVGPKPGRLIYRQPGF